MAEDRVMGIQIRWGMGGPQGKRGTARPFNKWKSEVEKVPGRDAFVGLRMAENTN
jgi:hypothetical protein